jgi:hypothetical protein
MDNITRSYILDERHLVTSSHLQINCLFEKTFFSEIDCCFNLKISMNNKNMNKWLEDEVKIKNCLTKSSVIQTDYQYGYVFEKIYINLDETYILLKRTTTKGSSNRTKPWDLFDNETSDFMHSIFFFCKNEKQKKCIELLKTLNTFVKKEDTSEMNLLCFSNDFYLTSFEINKELILSNEMQLLCYNESFFDVKEVIVEALNKKQKGIILLHGNPGTGKTTFIRSLPQSVKGKKFIYIPPDLIEQISNPKFISFFSQQKNSILIIEDAENVLKSRSRITNQSIANLLNISDGILSDVLQMQIICTFNIDINEIDPALRRDGRLIAEYKFTNLKKHIAQSLANRLYPNENIYIDNDLALSEVYNYKNQSVRNTEIKATI